MFCPCLSCSQIGASIARENKANVRNDCTSHNYNIQAINLAHSHVQHQLVVVVVVVVVVLKSSALPHPTSSFIWLSLGPTLLGAFKPTVISPNAGLSISFEVEGL